MLKRRVVVQIRQRLVREGVVLALSDEPDLEVVGEATDVGQLDRLCDAERPDVVVFELEAPDADPLRTAATIRRRQRSVIMVALGRPDRSRAELARRAGINATVGTDVPVGGLVRAVRVGASRPSLLRLPVGDGARTGTVATSVRLTDRQLEVLRLVGAGYTSRQIGTELGISAKTVENHKRQMFRRLGVQNQSHAVAIAMRQGLIGSGVGIAGRAGSWPSSS